MYDGVNHSYVNVGMIVRQWRILSINLQGRPNAYPAMQNASQKSLGDRNKDVEAAKSLPFTFFQEKLVH